MSEKHRYSLVDIRIHQDDVKGGGMDQVAREFSPSAEYLMGYMPKVKTMRVNGHHVQIEINPRLVNYSGGVSKIEYRPKLAIPGNGTLNAAENILGAHAIKHEVQRRVTDDIPKLSIDAVRLRLVDMAVVPTSTLQSQELELEGLSEMSRHTNDHGTEYSLIARGSIVEV